jgi:thiamine biosynthesis lipoprotein
VAGEGPDGSAERVVALVQRELLGWHERFSRFLPHSELSLLNGDGRPVVPASGLMCRLAQAVRDAGCATAGLVDATLLDELEGVGYAGQLGRPLELEEALRLAPPRRPAGAGALACWQLIEADPAKRTIARPPGVRLDSGGLAKGLFADVLAEKLSAHASFAVDCGGDLAIGGSAEVERTVSVESPFDGSTLHRLTIRRGGVATSGIGRRSWLTGDGAPAHHLLDPATGRPAFTGLVQVTALAPSALQAEVRAKAALLAGPRAASGWLPDGGVLVLDDGSHRVLAPARRVNAAELERFLPRSGARPRAAA